MLKSDNESLRSENEYLQSQCEDAVNQWTRCNQDITMLKSKLNEQDDTIKDWEQRHSDVDAKLKHAETKLECFDLLEYDFANQIRSLCDSVVVAGLSNNIDDPSTTPAALAKSGTCKVLLL